jgi:hypothetical protein
MGMMLIGHAVEPARWSAQWTERYFREEKGVRICTGHAEQQY